MLTTQLTNNVRRSYDHAVKLSVLQQDLQEREDRH